MSLRPEALISLVNRFAARNTSAQTPILFHCVQHRWCTPTRPASSPFSTSQRCSAEGRTLGHPSPTGEPTQSHDDAVAQETEKQQRTPWHRQGADMPPVRRMRSAGAMTKGKLLTTPSRLLKLIIPLTTLDRNNDRKTVEPLALVVHPQQPLSYLERLIQSELPTIKTSKGDEKIPSVYFKAENTPGNIGSEESSPDHSSQDSSKASLEETNIDGKVERTGVLNPRKAAETLRGGPGEGGVESYSGQGREAQSAASEPDSKAKSDDSGFVRWSASTEIGDFIRDAARGKEFAVAIEGAEDEIRVGVPSFKDRTHYLRQNLRKTSTKLADMAEVKRQCDAAAHQAAQRVAVGGFCMMLSWWVGVYYLTFKTDLGWDTMEPVTYLVGWFGLMAGYLWFLYHNREVSYRAAMNLTISRRQNQLYQSRGFDLERWEELVKEGNSLRSEIKAIAAEYDVEWHEGSDEHDETVRKALKEERDKKKRKKNDSDEKEEGEEEKDDD